MVKYAYGLVACIVVSSTAFGMNPAKRVEQPEEALPQYTELGKKRMRLEKEGATLASASVLVSKYKGKNLAAAEALEDQQEKMQSIYEDLGDQIVELNKKKN